MNKFKFMTMLLLSLLCFQVRVMAQLQKVVMGGQYTDPNNEKDPIRRMPAAPIYVNQDGHLFTFQTSLAGETVEIMNDETLLYTTVIEADGSVTIPDDISGEVELRLIRGSVTYHAIVELQ